MLTTINVPFQPKVLCFRRIQPSWQFLAQPCVNLFLGIGLVGRVLSPTHSRSPVNSPRSVYPHLSGRLAYPRCGEVGGPERLGDDDFRIRQLSFQQLVRAVLVRGDD